MYKTIVVDDEKIIREGIANFIHSENLGFKVVECLKDGRDAIEYLQTNAVDLVITDIRMTHVSGIELAKYIYESHLNVKVVILSGYKEFEYAQNAIKYNVKDYMLKPTNFAELRKTLAKIKQSLDEERKAINEKQKYSMLLSTLKEELFNDILIGGLHNKAIIDKKLKTLNLTEEIYHAPCLIMSLTLESLPKKARQNYGKEGIHNLLKNIFVGKGALIEFYNIIIFDDSTRLFAISKVVCEKDIFVNRVKDYLANIKEDMADYSEIRFSFCIERTFDSFLQLCNSNVIWYDNSFFMEKIKILLSYIVSGQKDQVEDLIKDTFDSNKDIPINYTINYAVKMFEIIYDKLKEQFPNYLHSDNNILDYKKLLELNNVDDIKNYSLEIVNNLMSYFPQDSESSSERILLKAKQYIDENFSCDISLQDVADHVFLSPVYFSRFFKKHTGENFSDYLIKVRMTYALELLKQNLKVEEVSMLSGYNSSRYFSRTFKKYYGYPPKEYVRRFL